MAENGKVIRVINSGILGCRMEVKGSEPIEIEGTWALVCKSKNRKVDLRYWLEWMFRKAQ